VEKWVQNGKFEYALTLVRCVKVAKTRTAVEKRTRRHR